MLKDHVKIGSAILNREYFWSVECGKCKEPPEVYYRPDEDSPKQRLDPRRAPGTGSHVFDLLSPGLYCLKNFCGGGFRFDAKVSVTEHAIDILHILGTAEV
ncbi:MAG: hypothetical protein HZC23_04995 [Rhodocyclales bacterium]|nr:hypothetical protein [Rhodocyclales bacterium]